MAGWAWAYWPGTAAGEPASWGSGKPVGVPTNQRAELMALLEALRWWSGSGGGPVTIYTDSMYAIKCMTIWGPSWKKKGWKRDSGEPLQNLDLIQPLVALWGPKRWVIKHVYGHQKGVSAEAYGNNWVDRAAVEASLGVAHTPVPVPVPTPALVTVSTPMTPAKKAGGPYVQSDLRKWFGEGSS